MNDEARAGYRIVATVIACLVVPCAALFATPGSTGTQTVQLVIAVAMSFFMWRGYSWARVYLAFGLGVGALLAAMIARLVIVNGSLWWGAAFVLLAAVYVWGAWTMWNSPKIEAYVEYRKQQRNPDMNFTTDGTGPQ